VRIFSSWTLPARKRREIDCLVGGYRGAVNFYIGSLWQNPGELHKETLAQLPAGSRRLRSMQK